MRTDSAARAEFAIIADEVRERRALPDDPELLDLSDLARREPVAPRFIVDQWLPQGEATLFAGHGGSGKSLIALTVAVCIASGRSVYGLRCERRRMLVWSAEDSADILHWRLRRVCAMLGVDPAALADWLFVYDASRNGGPFYVETRDGLGPTAELEWLRAEVGVRRAEVLMIDGTADAFAGNENARSHVRQFVQALRRLMPRDGAVLLLHHVDASSAHGGSPKGYSGSTAWHNSCRARWYLRPEDVGESHRVLIELRKSNHGKPGATVALRFSDVAGCFVSDAEIPTTKLDRELRQIDERAAVLELIRAAEAAGDPLPAATRSERSAHKVAESMGLPESLRGRRGRERFYEHIERLRAAKAIRVGAVKTACRHLREVYFASAEASERAEATKRDAHATEPLAEATAH